MHRWEYRMLLQERFFPAESTLDKLNELGAEGWEVCAMTEGRTYLVFYLKRLL